jgi:hypothetical protein
MFSALDVTINSAVAKTIFRVAMTQQPARQKQRAGMKATKADPDASTQLANSIAGQKSIMATVNAAHGGQQANGSSLSQVPTHTPDGRKMTRAERRKIERLQRKQAKHDG